MKKLSRKKSEYPTEGKVGSRKILEDQLHKSQFSDSYLVNFMGDFVSNYYEDMNYDNKDFSDNSEMSNSVFVNCSLRNTKFNRSNLVGSQFIGCKLMGTEFYGANLTDAKFEHKGQFDVFLSGANLTNVDLSNIHFGITNFYKDVKDKESKKANYIFLAEEVTNKVVNYLTFPPDLHCCTITGANFSNCNFSNCNFSNCEFQIAFERCNLSNCNFTEAKLSVLNHCDFTNCDFTNCDFTKARLKMGNYCDFTGSTFTDAKFKPNALFTNSKFIDCDLSNLEFEGVLFWNCNCNNANFTESKFSDVCKFSTCDCTDSNFTDTKFTNSILIASDFTNANFDNLHLRNSEVIGIDLSTIDLSTIDLSTTFEKENEDDSDDD